MIGTRVTDPEPPGPADPGAVMAGVELYTENRRIVGALDKGRVRVSDVFNHADISVVRVQNVSIYSLYDGNAMVTVPEAQVNTKKVILVIPRDSDRPRGNDPDKQLVHVPKQLHRVTMELPPYVISGYLHLPKQTRVGEALLSIPTKFIPLTGASIAVIGSPSEPAHVAAVIANRDYLQMMYPGQPGAPLVKPFKTLLTRTSTANATP